MSRKTRMSALGAGIIVGALFASPAIAQVSPPTSDKIGSFSQSVGINATCTRAYLAANNNNFPQSLSQLTQFMTLAPAADLCSPGAIASAVNNTPTPTAAQQSAYAQSVGLNVTCVHAFVLHANSLPQSQSELNQFQLAAPLSDLCTQAAVGSPSPPATH